MALSDDLRKRVVEAVFLGGLSRNAAGRRFGVSISSAVRWVTRYKATGQISPSPSGGDRRSGRIEAQRDYLLGLIRRTPDITLLRLTICSEIQERLIQNCGERFFGFRALAVPSDRHGVTLKKRPRTPRSSGARTFWSVAGTGSPPNSISIPPKSSSSTRPALPPISLKNTDAASAEGDCGPPCRTAITTRSRSLPVCASRAYGSEGLRPANERRPVRGLGRDMPRPHALARRDRRHGQSPRSQGAAGRATHQRGGRGIAISAAL